jgi:hypothetical protein
MADVQATPRRAYDRDRKAVSRLALYIVMTLVSNMSVMLCALEADFFSAGGSD